MTSEPGAYEQNSGRFYIGVGVLVLLLSIVGFAPALLNESVRRGPPTLLVIAHGALTLTWVMFFVAQATLIARGRSATHRRLGIVVAVLALVVVVLGVITSIVAQRRTYDLGGDIVRSGGGLPLAPAGIIGPLVTFFGFGALVAAAIWWRDRPQVHKRLMVFAVLIPLGFEPVLHLVAHLTVYWPGMLSAQGAILLPVMLLFLSLHAIYDRLTAGRIHPVSLWVPIGYFGLVLGMVFGIARLPAWARFSEWLIAAGPPG